MMPTPKKVAVITGASRGIGAGVVDGYLRQGWSVIANSLTIKPSDDPNVATVAGDVSDPRTAEAIVATAIERFGRLDTLINNAGVFLSKPFTEYSAKDYAFVTGVNVTGFFHVTQRVIVEMLKRGSGHVVNISTTLVDFADSSVPSVLTSLTKGGIAAATRSLAIEYARRGIRVNAVAPGVIQTPGHPPESYEADARREPIGHVGNVSDIVSAILFLESSPFITGEILHIDGGQIAGR
jgi:NAD(P)-dependent dehydrogenase (short-subunit alcohol dehydrogenase family)